MDINWPEGIDIADTAVTIPMTLLLKIGNDLTLAQEDRKAAEQRVITLEGEKRTLTDRVTALALQEKGLAQRILDLEKALAEATKPPVVTPPPIPNPIPRAPIVSKTEARDLAALTIEKGDGSPGPVMYTNVREVILRAKSMGFNAWRGFLNADEVRKHLATPLSSEDHLPAFGRKHGLHFIADTVDAVIPKLGDEQLRAYLKGLESMGALAIVFNDANQYETIDLVAWTKRVREVLPNMPLIASLTGVANIGVYPMFDLFEAQTFGAVNELGNFLARPFDIFCLDARKSMSAIDITTRAAIVLPKKISAFFYYADTAQDWLNMPLDKQAAIRKMIESWKMAR
jgi:hypothetical protein